MARIELAVGSVYGNAQDIAAYLQELLQEAGHGVRVDPAPRLPPLLTDPPALLLVCTSTTGQGELPDNILPFFSQLRETCPPVPQLRFAVVGLGDAAYDDTFAFGAKQFEQLLLELQAQPALETLILDAASAEDPFARTRDWCARLLQTLPA